jgi:hypothetical protein
MTARFRLLPQHQESHGRIQIQITSGRALPEGGLQAVHDILCLERILGVEVAALAMRPPLVRRQSKRPAGATMPFVRRSGTPRHSPKIVKLLDWR